MATLTELIAAHERTTADADPCHRAIALTHRGEAVALLLRLRATLTALDAEDRAYVADQLRETLAGLDAAAWDALGAALADR